MNFKTIYMETTKIPVTKTCAEIEELLIKHGIKRIWKDILNGQIEGIAFQMEIKGQPVAFKLPFRWKAIKALAEEGKTGYKATAEEEQARRIAARVVLRWIEAQIALVEMEMAAMEEVFLPYVLNSNGLTLYEALENKGGILALSGGKSNPNNLEIDKSE